MTHDEMVEAFKVIEDLIDAIIERVAILEQNYENLSSKEKNGLV